MLNTHHFLMMLLHLSIIYALEVTYVCCICMAEILYTLCTFLLNSTLSDFTHIVSLKLDTVGVCTQWKLADSLSQVLIYGFADCLRKAIEKMFIKQVIFISG